MFYFLVCIPLRTSTSSLLMLNPRFFLSSLFYPSLSDLLTSLFIFNSPSLLTLSDFPFFSLYLFFFYVILTLSHFLSLCISSRSAQSFLSFLPLSHTYITYSLPPHRSLFPFYLYLFFLVWERVRRDNMLSFVFIFFISCWLCISDLIAIFVLGVTCYHCCCCC